VHERNLRPRRVERRAMPGDIGQRLATERSAEVPQEDQQHRRPILERGKSRRKNALPGRLRHVPRTISFQLSIASSKGPWLFERLRAL
jgi:hypothetical protein